jgi:hypothetical protein
MLVKEWTTDENGRILATWVETERVSPLECEAARETSAQASDSTVPAIGLAENGRRASVPALQPATAQGSRVYAAFGRSSKGGSWTKVFTVLRSILP